MNDSLIYWPLRRAFRDAMSYGLVFSSRVYVSNFFPLIVYQSYFLHPRWVNNMIKILLIGHLSAHPLDVSQSRSMRKWPTSGRSDQSEFAAGVTSLASGTDINKIRSVDWRVWLAVEWGTIRVVGSWRDHCTQPRILYRRLPHMAPQPWNSLLTLSNRHLYFVPQSSSQCAPHTHTRTHIYTNKHTHAHINNDINRCISPNRTTNTLILSRVHHPSIHPSIRLFQINSKVIPLCSPHHAHPPHGGPHPHLCVNPYCPTDGL